MAILGPSNGSAIMKLKNGYHEQMKAEVLASLGHPAVQVELDETQFEMIIRTACDFMAGYFPFEEKIAVFYTKPLVNEYPLPEDGYWIKQVTWDPSVTRIGDIFGAESFLFNVGNITGINGLLLEFHLLQHYRKFSQRILGTEGRWEVKGENTIRLLPIPKGVYPVVVEYFPAVTHWRTPTARELMRRLLVAESMIILGNIRSRRPLPTPDGGSTTFNGETMLTKGYEEREKVYADALKLGEPPGIYPY